jgi:N6-adenosine-specific RNA methylase IME4
MIETLPFQVVSADPPWKFGDKLPGKGRGAEKHYPCLTLEELRWFPLPPIAADAWLFLWKVAAMPVEALAVVEAWGFTPKAEIVWVKTAKSGALRIGMGRSVRNAHESCIVATRGRPARASAAVPSVIHAPRGRHSEKPEEFFEAVERLTGPSARKCEMFARAERDGWFSMGNELVGRNG